MIEPELARETVVDLAICAKRHLRHVMEAIAVAKQFTREDAGLSHALVTLEAAVVITQHFVGEARQLARPMSSSIGLSCSSCGIRALPGVRVCPCCGADREVPSCSD